jgi:DNA-binding response OmpR family regulator
MKKVLIIEDEAFICRAYKDGLTRAGFEVVVAHDGKEGMEKLKSEKPDLVLLDLVMPVMDGFNVLEVVGADKIFKKTPIIVLSNLGQESDIKKSKELGAKDFLVKADHSMKDVIATVKKYL